MRTLVRQRGLALAAGFVALTLASHALGAPADSSKVNTSITPHQRGHVSLNAPKEFHPIAFPESLAGDIHTAWRLRDRVGKAFWPLWPAHHPAPLIVRSNPYDFYVIHPDPPSTTLNPKDLPGGGFYCVSMQQIPPPKEPGARIEESNSWWCVSYDAEGERVAGSRPGIVAMLATRDFMVFETTVWKPQWAGYGEVEKIFTLRTNKDLAAWLDSEAVNLRSAILTDDPKERSDRAHRAIRAHDQAEEIAQKDMKLKDALDWYETATRAEGAARYMDVLLQDESRSVVSGDTSYALPEPEGEFSFRARVWRAHLKAGTEKDVIGLNLVRLRDLGAMYCVLLDASLPGWQDKFFEDATDPADLLQKVLADRRNSKMFAG